MGEMHLLEIQGLSFGYGGLNHRVLEDINMVMNEGESVGIIGANGVGKSTLLKLLAGLLYMQEGRIKFAGLDMKKENLRRIRAELGYVFQDSDNQLFMPTVYEDVAFAPRNYGRSEEEIHRLAMKALEQVGMDEKKDRQIYRLSGGEKKLASIATVLAMDVKLILLDEPSVALDPRNRRNLIHVLNGLAKAKLIASHDLDFVYDTCQRAVLLSKGGIVAEGEAKELLTDQKLLEEHGLELPLSFSRRSSDNKI